MNFRKATDALLESVTLEDLAGTLGASVQAIRQARAAEGSRAHRSPPEGWEKGVKRLARAQASRLNRLAANLSA
jgi:hypothetical protein